MAHAALSSLMQTLQDIHHPRQSITLLKEKVSYLLDFLENSWEKRNPTVTADLGRRITDAAHEGEDAVESHFSKQIIPKSRSTFSWRKLCAEIRNVCRLFHHRETKHLHKIIYDFECILDSVSKIKDVKAVVEDLEPTRNFSTAGSFRIASSKNASMVGSNEDFIQIKDMLTRSSPKLEAISIVGMGGIGKTTLARNLYNDSLIECHFDTRAWVTVSQDYSVQEIVRYLLKCSGGVKDESHIESNIGKLSEKLYKSLFGRRYLIVMDDVWDTNVWDHVKRLFPDEYNGSRIVLTSRLSEVALYENSISYVHQMNLLGLEESWNLLCIKVFGEECCPNELELIGKKIAWNCKGLPLAIVVTGGLLSKGSKTPEYWETIAKNVTATTSGTDDKIVEILSSSYDHLPHHLKSCFLYTGAFPEDQEIFLSQLTMLWVAEGFLKPVSPKSSEEVAEEYLNNLIDRSLVMVGQRNHLGKIKTCSIHDLLRDLCVKKPWRRSFFGQYLFHFVLLHMVEIVIGVLASIKII